ncbi:YiiX/YebB-like N1pC/P60 family cysteine hydrolase [Paenibacillus arenosi]
MKKLLLVVLSAMMLLVIPVQAGATSVEHQLNEIVTLHGNGLTKAELKMDIVQLARETGKSEQQIVNQVLSELQSELSEDVGVFSSGGGNNATYLLDPSQKGHIFYTPATSYKVFNHGHVGMYIARNQIVEAANPDDGIIKSTLGSRKVDKHSKIQYVTSTTYTQDSNAADWAGGKTTGSYNKNFAINRSCGGTSFNCSQLVWCAFKEKANVDLDNDGGLGVYPRDIRDHKSVKTIKEYGV